MLTTMLVLTLTVPLLAAAAELVVARRRSGHRTGSAAVIGATTALVLLVAMALAALAGRDASLGDTARPWLLADGLGLVVGATVALIALTVLAYARRCLDAGTEATRTVAAGSLVLAGSLGVALAGRLTVLAAAWMLTSVAVLVLLWPGRRPARRSTWRRTALTLGLGDGALALAVLITVGVAGDPGFGDLEVTARTLADSGAGGAGAPWLNAATLVGALLVLAAVARAAQAPFPAWLPGTVAWPTPTSALLHAGVVNAGAVLLIRNLDVVSSSLLVPALLAVTSVVTVALWAGTMATRSDAKGRLAASTSAQMGFMLLAVAVGAPAAALTHLVGHALYKSARFLGVGGAVGRSVSVRRYVPGAVRSGAGVAAAVLAGAVVVAAVAASVAGGVMYAPDGWVLGAALAATAAQAAWVMGARTAAQTAVDRTRVMTTSAIGLSLLTLTYLGVVALLEGALGSAAVANGGAFVPPAPALAALVLLIAGGAAALRHPALAAPVWLRLSSLGTPGGADLCDPVHPAHRSLR